MNKITPTVDEVNANNIQPLIHIYTKIVYTHFIDLAQYQYVQHNEPAIHKLLSSDDMFGYVVKVEQKIIGYLFGEFTVLSDGRRVYYLSYVYIAPRFQHHRIGSILMKKLINKCYVHGSLFIVLTCDNEDKKIMNFYKKFGFVPDPVLRRHQKHDVLCLYL